MSSMKVGVFDSSGYMSEDLNRKLMSASQDLAIRAIEWCACQYNFDSSDALRMLNLSSGKMESKKQVEKKPKEVVVKPAFPLPYNGEHSMSCCQALRQNNGLYTQCQSNKKNGSDYCKSCDLLASKSDNGIPEYGTIQMRLAADIQAYVDPKGRKPVSYTKIMKKFKINEEQAVEEAGKFNININPIHFEVAEAESKRGRPKAVKAPKEPKGAKGRPKKAKKVLAIEGEEEDLFASLVANASINSEPESEAESEAESEEDKEEEIVISKVKPEKKKPTDEGKALKKQQEEEARALKKKQEEEAKAARALKKQQEEEARALKKQQEEEEKAAKALKKQQEEEAKAALKEMERIAKEEEKAAKALKKKQEEEAKAAKAAKAAKPAKSEKSAKSSKKEEPEDDGEPDVVKKIEFEGKKYLKSKKTGIVYDYNEYVKNQEQVVVGKWNESKNKIDFAKVESDSEEEEDEYESDGDRND
jgi:hypothetical protein